jgi:transglutaminase-like putative cysteine protease
MTEVSHGKRPGIPVSVWIDTSVLTVLSVIGLLGFATSFQNASYLLAGLGGLVVGTAAALVAAYFRFDALVTVLVVVVAYFLFGSALAMPSQALFGFLPTLETLSGLAIGAVFGWADIVTLTTPVAAPDYIGVLPYIAAWLVGLVSATLAARWYTAKRRTAPRSLVGLLAPIAIYVAGVLTGTEEPYLAAVRGISFAVIALVWMAWRVPAGQNLGASAATAILRRKLAGVGIVALAAVVVGGTLGFVAAPSGESRFVLRDEIDPPFDPLQYPSPLSGFRKYTKDLADTVLFTVDGLQAGDRIRLATMDAYDGKLWNVTGPEVYADGSGAFNLIGRSTEPPTLFTGGDTAALEITVADYADVWLPAIGYPQTIDFDPSADLDSTALRYNAATGIAVVTGGLDEGMRYVVESELQNVPTDAALAGVAVATVGLPSVANVPDIVAAKAIELAGDAATPIEQLRAIETALHTLGFLSHGTASEQVASSAGHGADRMKLLLERTQWIGDEEQFASVFALMARDLGYPARVVMGFAPEVGAAGGSVDVVGDDVTAWVEVAFDGVGWIPFYPTPDETDIPQDQTPKPKTEPQPQVRQPPRADTEQDDLVSAVELEDSDDDKGDGFAIPGWVWSVAAVIAIPAALYFVPLLLVAFFKKRRRERRLADPVPDVRAAGAWDELVDTYAELGYAAPRKATRLQLALGFEEQFREELAARERERASAAERATAKQQRAEAKLAAPEHPSSTRDRFSSIMDATVVRAKETAAWRPGVADDRAPLPVLPGLREFAVAADEAVFSGNTVPDERIEALWVESVEAGDAAKRSVSWFRRQLSKFRIRPSKDIAGTLVERLNAAVPQTMRGALTR